MTKVTRWAVVEDGHLKTCYYSEYEARQHLKADDYIIQVEVTYDHTQLKTVNKRQDPVAKADDGAGVPEAKPVGFATVSGQPVGDTERT